MQFRDILDCIEAKQKFCIYTHDPDLDDSTKERFSGTKDEMNIFCEKLYGELVVEKVESVGDNIIQITLYTNRWE